MTRARDLTRARRHEKLRKMGVYQRLPARPFVDILDRFVAAGYSNSDLAHALGCSSSSLTELRDGSRAMISRDLATRIGELTADRITRGYVPIHGPARRLAALMAMGHRAKDLNAALGIGATGTQDLIYDYRSARPNGRRLVSAAIAARIDELYRSLAYTPGPSKHTATRARNLGYLPAAAWDNIDDPDEVPNLRHIRRSNNARRKAAVVEGAAHLLSTGLPMPDVAARLGVSLHYMRDSVAAAARTDPRLDALVRELKADERWQVTA